MLSNVSIPATVSELFICHEEKKHNVHPYPVYFQLCAL